MISILKKVSERSSPLEFERNWTLLFILLLSIPLALISSCASEKNQKAEIATSYLVTGRVNLSDQYKSEELKFEFIDTNGKLVAPSSVEVDAAGFFKLRFSRSHLLLSSGMTSVDAKIANSLSLPENSSKKGFFEKGQYKLILQVMKQANEQTGSFLVNMRQVVIELSEQDLLDERKNIVLADIDLEALGAAWISVKDLEGKPVDGAKIYGFTAGVSEPSGDPVYLSQGLRPSHSVSGPDGRVKVYPIALSSGVGSFQYLIEKEGFCPFVSAKKLFKIDVSDAEFKAEVKACDFNDKRILITSDSLPTLVEAINGADTDVYYLNQNQFSIKLHSAARPGGEIRISLFEGIMEAGFQPFEDKVLSEFTSELDINLPLKFPASQSESGVFTLRVTSEDGYSGFFYGNKSLATPDISFMNTLKIESKNGVENLVSGAPKGEFYVSSDLCLKGRSIGIQVELSEPVFSSCIEGKATFLSDDVPFFSEEEREGGEYKFSFIIQDEYRNKSTVSAVGDTSISTFVDFGLPNLSEGFPNLGSDFGFMPKNSVDYGDGSAEKLWDFYQYAFDLALPLDITELANGSSLMIGFSSPDACFLNQASLPDGSSTAKLGLSIAKFSVIDGSANQTWQTCSGEDKATLLEFRQEHVTDGSISILVEDGAGNISVEPLKIVIPKCNAAEEGSVYCIN